MVPHLLHLQQVMNVLQEILSFHESRMCIHLRPPDQTHVHLTLLPLARLRSGVRHFLLHRPPVIYTQWFGAFYNGPHFVVRGYDAVSSRAGERRGKVDEDYFGGADFAIGAEGGGWIVGGLKGDVDDWGGFGAVDNGVDVGGVGFIFTFFSQRVIIYKRQ